MALIDPSTRKWLISEYGVPEGVEESNLPRAQKHALVTRECRCGRKIAGNVYFRHVKHCVSRNVVPYSDRRRSSTESVDVGRTNSLIKALPVQSAFRPSSSWSLLPHAFLTRACLDFLTSGAYR